MPKDKLSNINFLFHGNLVNKPVFLLPVTRGESPDDDGTFDQNEGKTNGDSGVFNSEAVPTPRSWVGESWCESLLSLLCSLRRALEVDISSRLRACSLRFFIESGVVASPDLRAPFSLSLPALLGRRLSMQTGSLEECLNGEEPGVPPRGK